MITAVEQARSAKQFPETRRLQLVDSESDFRFGVDPEMFGQLSRDFSAIHDVEFVVMNSGTREIAAKKLSRFINLLSQNGFDISEEE